jgi:hypothetical protein
MDALRWLGHSPLVRDAKGRMTFEKVEGVGVGANV